MAERKAWIKLALEGGRAGSVIDYSISDEPRGRESLRAARVFATGADEVRHRGYLFKKQKDCAVVGHPIAVRELWYTCFDSS